MNLTDSFLIARAIARTLRDSNQTQEIHRVEEISGRRRYRQFLRRTAGREDIAALLRDQPELSEKTVDYAALRALPQNTLGYLYARHLNVHGLSADSQATRTRYIDEPDIAYLMKRFRQTHDVWHALLDLGVQGHEEVIIHAFSWGQLRLPVSALVVLFGSLKHIVIERRWRALRRGLWEAYESGRDADLLLPVHWEQMWEHPIADVRSRYNVRPCTSAWIHG